MIIIIHGLYMWLTSIAIRVEQNACKLNNTRQCCIHTYYKSVYFNDGKVIILFKLIHSDFREHGIWLWTMPIRFKRILKLFFSTYEQSYVFRIYLIWRMSYFSQINSLWISRFITKFWKSVYRYFLKFRHFYIFLINL